MNSSVLQVSIALAQAVALLMSVAFISYALIIVVPYLRYAPVPILPGKSLEITLGGLGVLLLGGLGYQVSRRRKLETAA